MNKQYENWKVFLFSVVHNSSRKPHSTISTKIQAGFDYFQAQDFCEKYWLRDNV